MLGLWGNYGSVARSYLDSDCRCALKLLNVSPLISLWEALQFPAELIGSLNG